MKVLIAQINPTVGDLQHNTEKILEGIRKAKEQGADLVVFPELCLSGYPPEDLLMLRHFTDAVEKYLDKIVKASTGINVIVGTPRYTDDGNEKGLHNSAAVIMDGKLIGFQDKALLPTYDVFDERRYFEPVKNPKIWEICGKKVGVTICEDIWQHAEMVKYTDYGYDPIPDLKKLEPDLVVNLSASPFRTHKFKERVNVCAHAAKTMDCPVILCNQVGGNDSLIFDGHSLVVGQEGELRKYGKGFQEDWILVDPDEQSKVEYHGNEIQNLHDALVLGLRDYFHKLGFRKACLGLSGGIDSAVVVCIAKEALGSENVLAVTMPSRYSSEGSVTDSNELIGNLGIESRHIPIEQPFQAFLDILTPEFEGLPFDATEENLQARIRGMIMMAISNKLGYVVLSTGNKSEMALGYATLYGDMCGGLGVLSDVTKRQVYALADYINREKEVIPQNIITKPPSAELRPDQKDSDSLPDYEVIDNVVESYIVQHMSPESIVKKYGYPLELVTDIIQRIHRNEYKRRQSPPGLRISQKAFSVGRRFPIVERWV